MSVVVGSFGLSSVDRKRFVFPLGPVMYSAQSNKL